MQILPPLSREALSVSLNSLFLPLPLSRTLRLAGNLETEFATIPDHLALIVTEILKNALRATVEFYTLGNSILDADSKGEARPLASFRRCAFLLGPDADDSRGVCEQWV